MRAETALIMAISTKLWSKVTVAQAATNIIAGEIFKPDVMDALQRDFDDNCSPTLSLCNL